MQEFRPHTSIRAFYGFDGLLETLYWHIDNHTEFRSSYEIHTGANITHEGVREPFEIYPGIWVPAGEYSHAEAQLVFMSNKGAPASHEVDANIGGCSAATASRWSRHSAFGQTTRSRRSAQEKTVEPADVVGVDPSHIAAFVHVPYAGLVRFHVERDEALCLRPRVTVNET